MSIGYTVLGDMIIADTPYFMWGYPNDHTQALEDRREFMDWMSENLPKAMVTSSKDIIFSDPTEFTIYLLRWG